MRLHSVRNSCGCLLAALLFRRPRDLQPNPRRDRARRCASRSRYSAHSSTIAKWRSTTPRDSNTTPRRTHTGTSLQPIGGRGGGSAGKNKAPLSRATCLGSHRVLGGHRGPAIPPPRARGVKRRNNQGALLQDYVWSQPRVYAGPPRRVDPAAPVEEPPPRKYVPVVADLLEAAAREFRFVPQQPQSEIEYKRAYARVAAAAGIMKDQAVRIYAFEASGNGKYDVQAGLEYPRPGAQAVSTALGYNQLLSTNSVELLAEKGNQFVATLQAKAAGLSGDARDALVRKIAVLKAMIAFSRTVPDTWSAHDRLANTSKGLAIHALNLDIDVGPLLQTQKLLDSIVYARKQGYDATLTAAELEMMNLTGDGNGIDMIMMPPAWRERVPTANFFQPGGYARNPIAGRSGVVSKLLATTNARMDEEVRLQGAKDLAAVFK